MAADYEVVRYTPELARRVAELQVHLWGPDVERNRRYLAWKHEQNPWLAEPRIYLALHRGEPVAMRALFGALWEAGDRRFAIPCAGDTVVAPGHRDRGLFTRIMERALGDLGALDIEYVFNLSAGAAVQLGSRAMGWRAIGPVEPLARSRPRRRGLLRRVVGRRRARPSGGPLDSLGRRARRRPRPGLSVSREARPEAMAALVAGLGRDGRIRHVRDATWFAWRYRNPASSYRFLLLEQDGLAGYLVLGARTGAGDVRILDWEATHDAGRAELLRAALAWGRFESLSIWSLSLAPEDVALLHECGFAGSEGPASFSRPRQTVLVRAVSAERRPEGWSLAGRPLLDAANWDLREGYSDGA